MSDRDLKDGLKAAGYSFEEMWFYRHNQELLEDLREKKSEARPKLKLLQGGRTEAAPETEAGVAPDTVKKAA